MQFNIRGISRLPPSCGLYTSNWGTAARILVINLVVKWVCEGDHLVIIQFVSLYGRKISSTWNIFEELKHLTGFRASNAASCVACFLPSQHEIGVSWMCIRRRRCYTYSMLSPNAGASSDVPIRTQMMSCFQTRWHNCLIWRALHTLHYYSSNSWSSTFLCFSV